MIYIHGLIFFSLFKVLDPMNLSSEIILNMKPQSEKYANPMINFTILLESVGLNLNRLQVIWPYTKMMGGIKFQGF